MHTFILLTSFCEKGTLIVDRKAIDGVVHACIKFTNHLVTLVWCHS